VPCTPRRTPRDWRSTHHLSPPRQEARGAKTLQLTSVARRPSAVGKKRGALWGDTNG